MTVCQIFYLFLKKIVSLHETNLVPSNIKDVTESQDTSAPKGQQSPSPGQHPGVVKAQRPNASSGQKPCSIIMLLPLQGDRGGYALSTQGVALGYRLTGLSGRFFVAPETSIKLIK